MAEKSGRRLSSGTELSSHAAGDVRVVAKGGATQIVGQITQRSLSFFFTLAATNIIGVAGYGLYRKAVQVLMIAGQIGLAGFNYSSMRFITKARATGDHGAVRAAARTGLYAATLASLVVGAGLIVLADSIAPIFSGPNARPAELADLLRLGAAYVPAFALTQVLRYCTQAYKTMIPSVVVGNILQPVARFALGVAVLLAGLGVAGAVATLTISFAVAAVAGAWWFTRMLTTEERSTPLRYQTAAMVRFALPQGGSSLLGIQSLGLGVLVVAAFRGNEAVGLFAVALALQGPGGVFLSGIVNIWAPVVSDLYERGAIDRLESMYQTITRWIATFSFPVFAALILEADLFVRFFGSDAADAAPLVAIIAAGNFFYSGTGPTGYVLSMTGRPGINFMNSIVAVGMYVGLGAIVVPDHGVVGMAVVDASVTALVNTARVVEAKLLVGVQPFGRTFWKPVVATVIGAAVLFAWRVVGESIALEIAGIVVAALVYLVMLRVFGLDPEERYVWKQIRRRVPLPGRRSS